MSTEQNTAGHVDEQAETEEPGWQQPAIIIAKTFAVGEYSETVRVEITDVDDFPSAGDLTAIVETAIAAIASSCPQHPGAGDTAFKVHFGQMSSEQTEALSDAIRQLQAGGMKVDDALFAQAREHAKNCEGCGPAAPVITHDLGELVDEARTSQESAQAGGVS